MIIITWILASFVTVLVPVVFVLVLSRMDIEKRVSYLEERQSPEGYNNG